MRKTSPWDIWTLTLELLTSVSAEVEPRIREQKLETKEFFLLGKVDEFPNPAALARVLFIPKATITFMVKRMEAVGYLQRESEPGDLRRFRLTLTPQGRKALQAARKIIDEAFERRLRRITEPQRTELARILERMREDPD